MTILCPGGIPFWGCCGPEPQFQYLLRSYFDWVDGGTGNLQFTYIYARTWVMINHPPI